MKIEVITEGYPNYTITVKSPRILPIAQVFRNNIRHTGRPPNFSEYSAFWNYIAKCSRLHGIKSGELEGKLPYTRVKFPKGEGVLS